MFEGRTVIGRRSEPSSTSKPQPASPALHGERPLYEGGVARVGVEVASESHNKHDAAVRVSNDRRAGFLGTIRCGGATSCGAQPATAPSSKRKIGSIAKENTSCRKLEKRSGVL